MKAAGAARAIPSSSNNPRCPSGVAPIIIIIIIIIVIGGVILAAWTIAA
jgi:hypothetical protein